MSQLNIYRASAGSGKTFTLTREFIRLLFREPFDYRHILAVTFTNKATAEMRQRILQKLFELGYTTDKKPDYLEELMKELEFSESQVRTRAQLILRLLLHDFSRFSVSTIDSFFQQIIRAFARDAGLQLGFRTELDHQSIMVQAIDRVVLEMDMKGHETLKKWLLDFAEKKILEGKSWNINREISSFSEEIFKEAYQSVAGSLSEKLADRKFMSRYLSQLHAIIRDYEKQLQQIGEDGLAIIQKWDLDISKHFNNGSRSKVLLFKKMANQEKYNEEQVYALHNNVETWQKKSNPEHINIAIEGAFNDGLNQLLGQIIDLFGKEKHDYLTAKAIIRNFYTLGIINDVNQKILEVSREQNVFLLAGTNHLLTRIIRKDEAPFIYERTGTRYSHYMIDEFQDTSSLQYANFRPLINNSLAEDQFAMLVGDVKQSIYRWRNSDWTLLAEKVENDFSTFGSNVQTLDTNWRSSANVIAFNNSFFEHASKALQAQLLHRMPENLEAGANGVDHKIMEAYHDVIQKPAPNKSSDGGNVRFSFLEAANKDEFRETALKAAVDQIGHILNNGYSPSDICVLVRKKDEGIAITNALLSGEYHPHGTPLPVISNETLRLNSSPAVLFIINHLKFIISPDDKVLEAFIRLHWERSRREAEEAEFNASEVFHNAETASSWEEHLGFLKNRQQLPLYDLADELVRLLPESIRSEQGIYLQALLNSINNFSSQETADLSLFLDQWEKRGQFDTVMVPESQEAIRVMTIHKSKGLEFKAVVLPFCNWDLDANKVQNLLWCQPRKAPFNELDLVPVNYEKSLLDSHFVNEYLEELMHQYIDNLNLLYVAFTRAEQVLCAFCQRKKKEPVELATVSDLLWFHFEARESDQNELPGEWDGVTYNYTLGNFGTINQKKTSKTPNGSANRFTSTRNLPTMETFAFRDRVAIHLESGEYFEEAGTESGSTYGKVMHHAFELISHKSDLNDALKTLWFEGKIDEKEQTELKEKMEKWLSHPEVEDWFNGTYKVLSEVAILHQNIRRPDRVMINKNKTIVVDYKFGKAESAKHQQQVKGYMNKIKEMGYPNVKGFIWYVSQEEVVRVDNEIVQGTLF
ncbi:UvrD-helicase domain-containing protein [Marinilabilia rubra]|uniref:DNA 3'-5' helicase n=1 Tax=Marinilabilia rubra TaxID=2162893 RepID=A0A2U2B5K3_9BACT|nr:UvrD-helicase domain-containing protein [Marinilabilia rubra]PWD98336.1 ATP-dependent helicase [Marinilabilia rubra]